MNKVSFMILVTVVVIAFSGVTAASDEYTVSLSLDGVGLLRGNEGGILEYTFGEASFYIEYDNKGDAKAYGIGYRSFPIPYQGLYLGGFVHYLSGIDGIRDDIDLGIEAGFRYVQATMFLDVHTRVRANNYADDTDYLIPRNIELRSFIGIVF